MANQTGANQTGANETAMAVPRIALPQADRVALPQPLPPSEAARLRRILTLQAHGDMAEAEAETARLNAGWLLGTILADRYLHPGYPATREELTTWLARYGDQAQADAIQALLERLAPAPGGPGHAASPRAAHTPVSHAPVSVARHVRALFVRNRDTDALAAGRRLAGMAAPAGEPDAVFIAGLAAWRLGRPDTAADLFRAAYDGATDPSHQAEAAFWLARIQPEPAQRGARLMWLRRAALDSDGFYGRLAHHALAPQPVCPAGGTIGQADVDDLLATAPGRRAFALLQIGDKRRAAEELRALWLDASPATDHGREVMLLSRALGLTALAKEIAGEDQPPTVPAVWRQPMFRPRGGFQVDPALIYAVVQHESRFETRAVSSTGALGLMQILPNTAVGLGALQPGQAALLRNPAVNLAVGQRYLLMLAHSEGVKGNLLRVLAAYAQGLSGMRRWADDVNDNGDPLMFLEAIPDPATAHYVRTLLVSYWDYAQAMGRPGAGQDALLQRTYPALRRAERDTRADFLDASCAAAD